MRRRQREARSVKRGSGRSVHDCRVRSDSKPRQIVRAVSRARPGRETSLSLHAVPQAVQESDHGRKLLVDRGRLEDALPACVEVTKGRSECPSNFSKAGDGNTRRQRRSPVQHGVCQQCQDEALHPVRLRVYAKTGVSESPVREEPIRAAPPLSCCGISHVRATQQHERRASPPCAERLF